MFRRPTTQTKAGTVDKYIASSYQELLPLIENLDAVLSVNDGLVYTLKYLGAHPAPPSTRLDGNPIEDGDYYLDTTTNAFNYYDLAEDLWLSVDPALILTYAERAEAARDAAVISETNAANSEVNAQASATAAQTAETNAGISEATAATHASNAATSELDAETAATNAQTSETNALASENKAQQWADNPEDVSVETGKYSALHHAAKAEDSAIDANNAEINASVSAGNAATSEAAANASALNAFNSETAAATSETNALNAATAAATSESNANDSEVNALVSELAAKQSETNAATSEANASTSEANALSYAGNASASADSAANSESIAAANANFAGKWVDQTGAANIPYSVHHTDAIWMLVNNIGDTTLSEPTPINPDWVQIGSTGGTATDAARLGGQLPAYYLNPDNHDDTTSVNKWTTQAEINKLAAIEPNATADQTGSEIKALYEAEADTNAFTDAEKTEVASSVQSVVAGTNITISGGDLRNPIINLGQIGTDGVTNESTVTGLTLSDAIQNLDTSKIESGENVSVFVNDAGYLTSADLPPSSVVSVDGRSGTVILSDLYAPITHTHVKADISDFNDLDYAPAVHTHSAADIKTWYESNANTNAFTDSEKASVASALQSGDNLSELVNDAGYITLGEVPEGDAGGSYEVISGGGTLTIGWWYITDSSAYVLPQLSTISEGTIRIKVADGQIPTVSAFSGDTLQLDAVTSDTQINFTDQAIVELLYTATHWDLYEIIINSGTDVNLAQYVSMTDAEVKIAYERNADTNALTDTLLAKLTNIEDNATADQTGAEIKTAYEAEANTNAFTDAEKAQLAATVEGSGITKVEVVANFPGTPVNGVLYIKTV